MGQELRVGKDDNAFGVGHCCRCAYCCVTHTRLTALCPGLPGWAGTRKVKPTWILLKQETVSGSEIRWAICKSAPCSRQITTPAPHHSVILQAGCPSCRPTNSVKALKADIADHYAIITSFKKCTCCATCLLSAHILDQFVSS